MADKATPEERAARREAAPKALKKAEIPFTTHNYGVHLVIHSPDESRHVAEIWPGANRWRIYPEVKTRVTGVEALIRWYNLAFRSE